MDLTYAELERRFSESDMHRRRAERRVELLSAFARGVICEFDGEGCYRDVWATDERLLARPAHELLGRTIVEALGEEVGQRLMEGTAQVYATGIPQTFEYTLPLAVGLHTFEARVVRIRAESGPEPYRAVALIRDVTEEKDIARKLDEAERLAALGTPLPRFRLLVIDDDPPLLRILDAFLSEEHEVVTADGGGAALGILTKDGRFDAILCDLMMPLGDGISFYEGLGEIRPELQARVVFMTGGAFTSEAKEFLESVPNTMIEKPFAPEALHDVLERLCGERGRLGKTRSESEAYAVRSNPSHS